MRLNSALSTRPLLISTSFREVNDMSIKWKYFLKRSVIPNAIVIEFNNNEIFY